MIHLLLSALPQDLAGDLIEEFGEDPQGLRRQIVLSVLPLVGMAGRRYVPALAPAWLAALAVDYLWSFVLSQVPLKTSGHRGLDYWIAMAMAALAGAAIGRLRKRGGLA